MKTQILLLITLLSREVMYPVTSQDIQDVFVRTGEIAVLRCPVSEKDLNNLLWKINSSMGLRDIREEEGRPVINYQNNLLMLKVFKKDSGIYSCLIRNARGISSFASFNLTVYSSQCVVDEDLYDHRCLDSTSCSIKGKLAPVLTSVCECNVSWFKISELKSCSAEIIPFQEEVYFKAVAKSNEGIYISNHSCRCKGQLFYKSTTTDLLIIEDRPPLQPNMIKPQPNEIIEVELGKQTEIMCSVIVDRHADIDFMSLYWINGSLAVPEYDNMTVFYNNTIKITVDNNYNKISWLIFKKVLKAHLNSTYTCKFESTNGDISVSITLKEKAPHWMSHSVGLPVGVLICICSGILLTILYFKLKIDMVLFCRSLRGQQCSPSDGKLYDAYILHYKTCDEQALTVDERDLLLRVLETQYSYRLCIYDRDVPPGGASVEEVLEHVKQSRRLLLIPYFDGPEVESQYGLLGGLHAALVERQTRLLLIQKGPHSKWDALPEPLRLVARSGGAVIWRGDTSHTSSAFWKHMLYHMPTRRVQQKESMTLL